MTKKRKWLSEAPTHCDLCNDELTDTFVDGKTLQGPWGNMCVYCHDVYGVGFGTGRGQKYNLETLEKLEG